MVSFLSQLYVRLPDEAALDEADLAELESRSNEVTGDMNGKGYVPLTTDDMLPNPGVVDAAEMRREGGAGKVSLPPTVYTAPIVLALTATPAERRQIAKYVLLLGPVWMALLLSIFAQLVFSHYMLTSVVQLVTDDLAPECEGETSGLLRSVALMSFIGMVMVDVNETYSIHIWLRTLPASDQPEYMRILRFTERHEPPEGKSTLVVPVSGIAQVERASFYFTCLVPKLVVSVACLVAGSGAVLHSADDFGLVLNAVAATFILQIDDFIYQLLVPETSRKMADAMPAINVEVDSSAKQGWRTNELYQRPVHLLGLTLLGYVLSLALSIFWCTVPLSNGTSIDTDATILDSNDGPATVAGFWATLGATAVICACLSWRELLRVETAQQKLTATYKTNMKGKARFELDDPHFGATNAAALAVALMHMPNISEVKLRAQGQGSSIVVLFEGLKSNTAIKSFDVDGHALQIDELKGTKPTEKIDLSGKGLGVASAIVIASCIKRNSVLEELNVSSNNLGPKGGAALAKGLEKNTTLKSLNVDGRALQIDELKGTKPTEKINLSSKRLGVASAVIIANCIKENSALKELDLSGNELCGINRFGNGTYTAEGITKLCEALQGSAVTSLSLRNNIIGAEGASKLADVLKETQITDLDVDGHALQIHELKGMVPTERIDLSGKGLGTASAFIIANCIKENGVLKELNLNGNGIGHQGGKALAESLKGNLTLTSLGLEKTSLTNEAKQAVKDAAGSGVQIQF